MARFRLLWPLLPVVLLVGCQSPILPDPNDPDSTGVVAPDVIRRNLAGASQNFFSRVAKNEITDAEAHEFMRQYAEELLQKVNPKDVPDDFAWEYAEVLLTARRWEEAQRFLEIALRKPRSEDRRVNDGLRLARTQCELGVVPECVATARTVFDAGPKDKAPILTSVLLEIVPAGAGKGHDRELANLLLDAVKQSEETVVDPESEAGAAFIVASRTHGRNAFTRAIALFQSAGDTEGVQRAEAARAAWIARKPFGGGLYPPATSTTPTPNESRRL